MQQSFLQKLADRIAGRREKAVAGFDALIQAVADDKPPSAEQAEAVLHDAGRSAEDLAAAVKRLKGRREAAARIKRAEGAQRELDALEAKAAALNSAHMAGMAKLEKDREAQFSPMRARRAELEKEIADGKRAESYLRTSAHEPPGLADLREQLAQARRQRDNHLKRASEARSAASDALSSANAAGGYSDSYRAGYRQEASRCEARAEQCVEAAEPHAEECRRLEKEIEKVENLALNP